MIDPRANESLEFSASQGRTCPICNYRLEESGPLVFGEQKVFCPRSTCGVELKEGKDSQLLVRTFQLNHHQSLCVFPFAFGTFEESAQDSFEQLRKSPRWELINYDSDKPEDVERTEYFLPYARRFLFPSLYDQKDKGSTSQEPTCQHFRFDMSTLGAKHGSPLSVTLKCYDDRLKKQYTYPIRLLEIQLSVFNYHVGFLKFRFESHDNQATYFDQMNTAAYFRLIAPLYPGFEMPKLDIPNGSVQITQLLPFLLAEFSSQSGIPKSPEDFLPNASKQDWLQVKPIYDDRMMVYTFSCIKDQTALKNIESNSLLLSRKAVIKFNKDKQEEFSGDVETNLSDSLQQRWWGFSKEGGALAVFDSNRFHEKFIGNYFNTYYFDIFLLAAMQRVTLLLFFERLSDIPSLTTHSSENQKLLRRLRKDLLLFKNQSWFSQLTNRERGLELWRYWQDVFENRTLLEEVNEQAQELDAYIQSQSRERLDWVVRLGGFLATAVPAILGLPVLFGKAQWVQTTQWVLLLLLLLGTFAFAWRIFQNGDE